MADCREQIIDSVLTHFSEELATGLASRIRDRMILELGNYEVTKRETGIVVYDDTNDRLLKRYIGCIRIDGKSEKTILQYARTCRKLAEATGKRFTEMGVYDIRMYLAMEKERGLSNTTVENERANLSAFFQWLTLEEEINKNPCMKIKPIKCPKEVRLPFTDVEIDEMRTACKNLKERALIEVLLASGVRVSELSQMDINDINFSDKKVHVKHGKGAKERITYLTPVARRHLAKYLESRTDVTPALFLNQKGGRLETGGIQHILKQIEARSGVTNVHPHRFRRTFATGLASRGMDIQEIKTLLGHSDINTTMQYVYTNDTQVKSSYERYCV